MYKSGDSPEGLKHVACLCTTQIYSCVRFCFTECLLIVQSKHGDICQADATHS